jgi:hypothetical protein
LESVIKLYWEKMKYFGRYNYTKQTIRTEKNNQNWFSHIGTLSIGRFLVSAICFWTKWWSEQCDNNWMNIVNSKKYHISFTDNICQYMIEHVKDRLARIRSYLHMCRYSRAVE